jgi:hypothetical protein
MSLHLRRHDSANFSAAEAEVWSQYKAGRVCLCLRAHRAPDLSVSILCKQ